jgi:hypothetical protein
MDLAAALIPASCSTPLHLVLALRQPDAGSSCSSSSRDSGSGLPPQAPAAARAAVLGLLLLQEVFAAHAEARGEVLRLVQVSGRAACRPGVAASALAHRTVPWCPARCRPMCMCRPSSAAPTWTPRCPMCCCWGASASSSPRCSPRTARSSRTASARLQVPRRAHVHLGSAQHTDLRSHEHTMRSLL